MDNNASIKIKSILVISLLMLSIFTALLVVLPENVKAADNWWDNNWDYRRKVEINASYIDGALTNFPVLIKITADSNYYEKGNYTDTDGGSFFMFTDSSNTTKLNHEMEYFNHGGGTLTAAMWVNVTSVNATGDNSFIWMYYGNDAATDQQNKYDTWDINYTAVWHMHETGGCNNSAQVNYNLTEARYQAIYPSMYKPTYDQSSAIGRAVDFDGVDDVLNFSVLATNLGDQDTTIEIWAKADGFNLSEGGANELYSNQKEEEFEIYWRNASSHVIAYYDNGTDPPAFQNYTGSNSPNLSYYTFQWDDGTSSKTFFDSVLTSTLTTDIVMDDKTTKDNAIGGNWRSGTNASEKNWNGTITEVRISNILRSTDYQNATYDNIENYDTFIIIGDEEARDGGTEGTTIEPIGYLYGNWSFSEHLENCLLEEDWLLSNDTYWQISDISTFWDGRCVMHYNNTNGTAPEIGFAILNNSGMNKSQTLAWTKYNLTDSQNQNVIYNGVIYAARTTTDWDCALYGFNELYLLTYNGTGFVNTNDSTPVTDETEAYNYWQASWGWYDEDYYYEPDPQNHGSWIKTIYNSLCGRLLTKMYGDSTTCTSFLTEPAGWTLNMEDATNFSNQTAQGFGIVTWNPDDYNYSAYFDTIEVWQLNYTRNFSAPFEPDGNGTYGRPHMDFPVLDMAEILPDMEQFLNDTIEGNITLDDISDFLKDNITNLMNLEARIYEPYKAGNYDQNDSVYYYSCIFTNFTLFNDSMDNNQLYISIIDCTDGQNTTYLDSAGVGIDVDNNYTWDSNDRFYFWDDSGTNWQWNGSAWSTVFTPVANAFETPQYTWRNFHRYNSHMQYAILIPQSDLIKNDASEINVTDIFGLSIFTHNLDDDNICFWQNKNESACNPFYSEIVEECKEYFINETGLSSEETLDINTTNLYRWGEGEIGTGTLQDAASPVFTNQNPANETMYVNTNLGEVSVTITSPGTFSYEIRLYSTTVADDKGATSGVSHSTGTKTHDFTGSLQPGQNYTWWVNATNSEGKSTNESYWFTLNNTYSMTTDIDSNVTNVDQTNASLGQNVNISVNLTNTGTGRIDDINVQHTFLNCSCSLFNFTLLETNLNLSNVTFYNDSCYLSLNIANLSASSYYEYYMVINITGCLPANSGNIRIYSNVTGEYAQPAQDYVDIAWGKNTSRLRITYTTEGADLTPVINAVIIMTFVLVVVIVASLLMYRIGYFGNKDE